MKRLVLIWALSGFALMSANCFTYWKDDIRLKHRIENPAKPEIHVYSAYRVGTFYYFFIPIPLAENLLCVAAANGDFECK